MAARRTLHRARVPALVCILLLVPVGCDTGDPSGTAPARQSGDAAPSATSAALTGLPPRPVRKKPVACPSGRMRSWSMHDIATVSQGREVADSPPDVAVSTAGTATVAWSPQAGGIRTAYDPPAPGDPQDPTHGAPLSADFPAFNDYLGIDAADKQTLVYSQHVSDGGNAHVDVVRSDRAPGAQWSSFPAKVVHPARPDLMQLAVNSSGAAVVVWQKYPASGRAQPRYSSYRDAAGAAWTSPERVLGAQAFAPHVGIDDAGRVLVAYNRIADPYKGGVWAVRRSATGGWEKPQHLIGPDKEMFGLTVGARGAAVVTYGEVYNAGVPIGPQFTSRMSPDGTWGAPVRQPQGPPFGLISGAVDMDAKGRVLIAGWDGTDVLGRWSSPDGRWRKPFVLAARVSKPRHFLLKAALNRRGDALVVWGAKTEEAQLWARYKPVGQEWTKPVMVTRADSPPSRFGATVGECGHAAVAWTTRDDRQVQVRRASPKS